jgi:hypothetical protein
MEKNQPEIPELPQEVSLQVIEQIINTSETKPKALNALYNYALTNNLNALMIQTNKELIQKLLKEKFEFNDLATGNYEDQTIQEKTIKILKKEQQKVAPHLGGVQKRFCMALSLAINRSKSLVKDKYGNDVETYFFLLENAVKEKKIKLALVALGGINRFYNNQRLLMGKDDYIKSIKKIISLIDKKSLRNSEQEFQLLNALIRTGINKFGKNYVIAHRGAYNTKPTILDYAKSIGNPEIINYLEKLGFISLPVRNLEEEPIERLGVSRGQYEGCF